MLLGLFDDAMVDASAAVAVAVAAEALAECTMMDVLVVLIEAPAPLLEALAAAAEAQICECALVIMGDDKGRGLLPPTDSRAKLDVTSGDAMPGWLDRCPLAT